MRAKDPRKRKAVISLTFDPTAHCGIKRRNGLTCRLVGQMLRGEVPWPKGVRIRIQVRGTVTYTIPNKTDIQ